MSPKNANKKNELFNDDDGFYDEYFPDVPTAFTFMSALHEKFKDIRYDWRPDFLKLFRFPAFDSLHWDEPIDYKAILATLPNDYKSIWIALYHNAKARQEKLECIFSQVAPFLDVYQYYDSVRYWDGIRKIKDSLRFVCYIDDIKTIFEDPGYRVLVPNFVYSGGAYYPAYCPEDIKEKCPWMREVKERDYLERDTIFAPYFLYARKLTLKNYPKDVKEKYHWIRDYKAIWEPDADEIIDLYTYNTEFERVAFCAAVCDIEAARHGYKLIRTDTFEKDLYFKMASVNYRTPKDKIDEIFTMLGMVAKED
jgi:hypothetical protein